MKIFVTLTRNQELRLRKIYAERKLFTNELDRGLITSTPERAVFNIDAFTSIYWSEMLGEEIKY